MVLFEPGKMIWDDDLLSNSKQPLETLIRVGMSVGHAPDTEQFFAQHDKFNTKEDIADAERRVEGSLAPRKD